MTNLKSILISLGLCTFAMAQGAHDSPTRTGREPAPAAKSESSEETVYPLSLEDASRLQKLLRELLVMKTTGEQTISEPRY